MSEAPIVVCLGRIGDILNALPIAYELSKAGVKPKFVTTSEFWGVLEGVTYVQPIVWAMDYKELPYAIRRTEGKGAIIAQTYMHPDHSWLTDSYQKEAYRHAGWLDKFGKIPLVFDNRNPEREKAFDLKACLLTNPYTVNKSTILVATKSVSSPYKDDLLGRIRKEFPGYNVIDLSAIHTPKVYDMLGIMDNSACLVTVDTMHLHLARASKIPVVALVNDGWFGSSVEHYVKCVLRYSEALSNPERVIAAIREICP